MVNPLFIVEFEYNTLHKTSSHLSPRPLPPKPRTANMHFSQTEKASSSTKTADMPRTPPYSQTRPNIIYDELFIATSNKFLGPMSLESFFNRYLPNDPASGPQPQSRSIRDRRMRSGKNVFHPVFVRGMSLVCVSLLIFFIL